LKTGRARKGPREFESHPFRHILTPLPFAIGRHHPITYWHNAVISTILIRAHSPPVVRIQSKLVGYFVGMGGHVYGGQMSAALTNGWPKASE